jgi:hypothetical protein
MSGTVLGGYQLLNLLVDIFLKKFIQAWYWYWIKKQNKNHTSLILVLYF